MKPGDLFKTGRLADAVEAALKEVKGSPADTGKRLLLCELLCFSGDLQRADNQLDILKDQSMESAVNVVVFRQLIRAEQARRDFYEEGAAPELMVDLTDDLKRRLEASVSIREGALAEAARQLVEAETRRPETSGTCDGEPFDDFRDLDDLTAGFLEILAANGKYYWVPWEAVQKIEFERMVRARDLLWRPVRVELRDGPDTNAFFPTLYAGSHQESDENIALGRATDWKGGDGSPVRGLGLRSFMVGDSCKTVQEINSLAFGAKA